MSPGILLGKKELTWVLDCVGRGFGVSDPGKVPETICSDAVWPSLQRFLEWHRLAPLFLEGLGKQDGPITDLPWLEDLRTMVSKGVRRNLLLSSRLVAICHGLQQANLPFLVLKGIPLAVQVYGDLGMRLGRDIDVLIPQAHYRAAVDVLKNHGYLLAERSFPYASHLRFGYKSGEVWHLEDVLLDLHWHFTNQGLPFDLDPEAAIESAEQVIIGDCRVPVLSAEHRFLYLVHHAAKHQWMRFFWLADLAASIRRQDISTGDSFQSMTASLGLSRPLAMSCLLLEELFKVATPEGLWPAGVHRGQLAGLCQDWRTVALEDLTYTYGRVLQLPNARVWRWSLALSKGPVRKTAVAFNLGFKPSMSDLRSLALPQKLRCLYWVWRPLRLVLRKLGFHRGR